MKEAIEHLTKNVVFWDNEGSGGIAELPREDYDAALAILRKAPEQPQAGDFTKELRTRIIRYREIVSPFAKDTISILNRAEQACDRLDRSEASRERKDEYWIEREKQLEASRKELLAAIIRVVGLGCLRDKEFAACKKGDMCCICQAKVAIEKAKQGD